LPERVGRWWNRQTEIDVLAISDSERALLAGECKWSVNPVGTSVLDDLKRKVQRLNAGGKWRQVHYVIFARAGFTPALLDLAAVEDVMLVEATEMI
jgi:AAA+ ATPase superfamily predicted ATPase